MASKQIRGGSVCDCEEISKLKCQIAKLQQRVCELECSRGFIVNPQPYYTPVFYSASTGTSGEVHMDNCTTINKEDDGKATTGSHVV